MGFQNNAVRGGPENKERMGGCLPAGFLEGDDLIARFLEEGGKDRFKPLFRVELHRAQRPHLAWLCGKPGEEIVLLAGDAPGPDELQELLDLDAWLNPWFHARGAGEFPRLYAHTSTPVQNR